jgi:hypothetical protein
MRGFTAIAFVCFTGVAWAQADVMTVRTLTPAFKARLLAADSNHDGRLTLAELRAAFAEGAGITYAHDKNNDGALSGAEIDTAATMETALVVGRCDKNGDEQLTGAEAACYAKAK